MQYANINHTDLKASVICFGTGEIGKTMDMKLSYELMNTYCDRGGNFLDTASCYANWLPGERNTSEKAIGRWMREHEMRHHVILGTKGGHSEFETLHISRIIPELILQDLELSLKLLMTDYIDLYWLHRDNESRPVEELIDFLEAQVKAGKIRYYACSNWKPSRMRAAAQYAAAIGAKGFVANQMMWSIATVNPGSVSDKTLVVMDAASAEFHAETGMAAIPYTSQANGFFNKLAAWESGGAELSPGLKSMYYNEENVNRLHRLQKLAGEMDGVTISQLALACLVGQPFTTIPIVGCKTLGHLNDSMKAGDIHLTPDMVRFVEKGE